MKFHTHVCVSIILAPLKICIFKMYMYIPMSLQFGPLGVNLSIDVTYLEAVFDPEVPPTVLPVLRAHNVEKSVK